MASELCLSWWTCPKTFLDCLKGTQMQGATHACQPDNLLVSVAGPYFVGFGTRNQFLNTSLVWRF